MTRRRLKGSTVVITGASSGIGQATAEVFARHGARLVLAARGVAGLETVAQRCRVLGADALVVPTDVTDAAAVRRLAGEALRFGKTIDVWVSNVGVGAVGRFEDTPIEAHEQVIRSNLLGHINDAHAVVPVFLRQRHGTFVNMISLGGFAAAPFATAYSASKFGLKGFSEALRAELASEPGIRICDIYPAFIDTPGVHHGANYTGRALSVPPPVYDARKVAAAIVNVARDPRDTTVVGSTATLLRLCHFLAPAWTGRAMAGFMQSYFRQAPHAAVSDGNLFAPPREPGGIDGGFRSPAQRAVAQAALGVAALAGIALLAGVLRPTPARGSRASAAPHATGRSSLTTFGESKK